jgi:hypothetical protein
MSGMPCGYLTQDMITQALDDLWFGKRDHYQLPRLEGWRENRHWQDRHGHIPSPRNSYGALIYPGGNLDPLPLGVPELDWTVQAGGWRLVIEDGAITGIKEI